MTSAIQSGWICVGIGLLTAWFFPPFHLFFSIAIVLSVVAMASHQVRGGLLLLAGAFTSMALCGLLFFFGVVGIILGSIAGLVHAAAAASPRGVTPLNFPAPIAFQTPAASLLDEAQQRASFQPPVVSLPSSLAVGVATRPLRLNEVMLMLRTGLRDDEILANIADRQLVETIDQSEADALRSLGAGDRLLNDLRTRRLYAASTSFAPAAATPARAPAQVHVPPRAAGTTDYAAKDRQIAVLSKQIDSIDASIRYARSHLPNARAYIDGLDKQRNDLRRQKWALEGR